MHQVHELYGTLPPLTVPVVTLGAFDGVHRGHQRVLTETVAWARELGGESVVVTFARLPKSVTRADTTPAICPLDRRLALIEACGLDVAVVLPFDHQLSTMPAEEFVRQVLLDWIGARHVVLGHDSRFGYKARGNLDLLRRFESEGLLSVRSPDAVLLNRLVISSTAIRDAVSSGDLELAEGLLGRPYVLSGDVVTGQSRGRTLGFPTANLQLTDQLLPPPGVYASIASHQGQRHRALSYVGTRPTFDDSDEVSVEVYLVDDQRDLYGERLDVEFLQRLRGDLEFPTADALVEQMHADLALAAAVFHSHGF
jgi:riboflavin kinase/FMN adenylyltransferase